MAKKLKAYRASIGFFDLAIAAPSMKAAIEAWGANADIFHSGFAEETEDPKIVDAVMNKPGIVLRRPIGSDEAFGEKSKLPKPPPEERQPAKTSPKSGDVDRRDEKAKADELKKREAERQRAEKERARMIDAADAKLESAKGRHDKEMTRLAKRRADLEAAEKLEAETWEQDQRDHAAAVKRAGSITGRSAG